MTKEEFINLHGEKTWLDYCYNKRGFFGEPVTPFRSIEDIIHGNIIFGLRLLGFRGDSLLAAKRTIKRKRKS
ncbi:MAG: hypothetical protein WC473_04875 [Patescibacteria group bacterium]